MDKLVHLNNPLTNETLPFEHDSIFMFVAIELACKVLKRTVSPTDDGTSKIPCNVEPCFRLYSISASRDQRPHSYVTILDIHEAMARPQNCPWVVETVTPLPFKAAQDKLRGDIWIWIITTWDF